MTGVGGGFWGESNDWVDDVTREQTELNNYIPI